MEQNKTNKRISVVDSLRGFAIVGIIIIHFLEHLNFYSFPEPTPFEQGLWDTVFYLGSNKMYAIFALLFGLSCFIQHHNAEKRGEDFRLRFAWRMLLLFGWGMLDLVFFNGDILCTYAVLGLLLIPLVKANDNVLLAVAALLFLQPIELFYIIRGLINPDTMPMNLKYDNCWAICNDACANGGFLDVAKANLIYGPQSNIGWSIDNGRVTQTLMLFVTGMILGRKRRFLDGNDNHRFWKKTIIMSVFFFAFTQLLLLTVAFNEMAPCVGRSLNITLNAWRNFAMMAFYVGGLTLLYYKTSLRKTISHLECIGKMSLTDYLLQSIIGGFLFYNWGLGLYTVSSHGISFILGIAFCICLYYFCHTWTSHFRRGPLEEIWARATHIKIKPFVLFVLLVSGTLIGCQEGGKPDSTEVMTDSICLETTVVEKINYDIQLSHVSMQEKVGIWTYTLEADYPVDGNELLTNNVREWMNELLGGTYMGDLSDTCSLFQHYVREYSSVNDSEGDKEMAERGIECSTDYSFKQVWESEKLITFLCTVYWYGGGAHGSTGITGMTFRKSDGHRFGKEIFRTDAELQAELNSGLKKYFEVSTDEELDENLMVDELHGASYLPMPSSAPWIEKDGIHLMYGQYEIACYAAGMPAVVIPFDNAEKYLIATILKELKNEE